ncbi:MAG: c-type cytochrome [Planctomycetaceae bacterium]|nr:c-type cytochrome [Planctomycetales bacterium]MCB9937881.1 c-type cytochrome [Planctomycetaceae bacterium]
MRLLPILLLIISCITVEAADEYELQYPLGLKRMPIPETNELTAAKIELGKQLYFDPRLSRDDTVSCASCHDPKKGWSNGDHFATGVRGQRGGRSAPTIINSGYSYFQFWDGRAIMLEGQALGPIQNPIEMDLTLEECVAKLNAIEGYRKQFQAVFGTDVDSVGMAKAIASFERTVLSGNAPHDKFKAGDEKALSAAAQRGSKLFFGKANCSACHAGPNFSDFAFHNIGVGMDKSEPDVGRFSETQMLGDRGSFKTPTLREIARTAPYMHDGSVKTLEDVVEYYDKGGFANPQLDEELFPLKLTPEQKADLVTFLKEGLSSEDYPDIEPPTLPK